MLPVVFPHEEDVGDGEDDERTEQVEPVADGIVRTEIDETQ